MVDTSGGIDICFNATSNDDIQGKTLLDMPLGELMQPVTKALTAHYRIVTAVAPHMATRGGGVILVMAGGREAIPLLGGAHVAWTALAGLCRQFAADLGPQGIRVAWILSPGSPGFAGDDRNLEPTDNPSNGTASGTQGLIPRHHPSLDEVAGAATFLASDLARTMTATEVNLTGGAVPD